MAPPKGLEPLTDWLTASRSTELSYGGTVTASYDFDFLAIFKRYIQHYERVQMFA